MRFRIGALLALVALSLVVAGCTGGAAPPVVPEQQDAATSASTGTRIMMSGFTFQPAEVTIEVGETVTWLNSDDSLHTVTGAGGISSPQLAKGEQYSKSFDAPGTYTYSCTIHPAMAGTVTVK